MHRLDDYKRNSFAYTDSCIGVFLGQLRSTPLWDSLLVIIVPDHGIPYADGQSTSDVEVARIPMLWVGGAVRSPRIVDLLCSQSDLAATLLAQMNIPADHFPFSRNIMGVQYPQRRQFAIHSDKNCLNLILPDGHWLYDCVSRTLQPDDKSQLLFVEALMQRLYKTTASL